MKAFNPKESLKSVRVILIALLLGILAFMLVTLSIVEEMAPFQFNTEDPMFLMLLLLALAVVPASIMVPRIYLKKNPPKEGLQAKMAAYRTLVIIKAALWAGVSEFGLVIFMITDNPMPLAIVILAMIVMVSYYPTIENIQKTMNLSQEEVEEFRR